MKNVQITRFMKTMVSAFRMSIVYSLGIFSVLLVLCGKTNFAAPGDLDASFGTGGKVTTAVGIGRDLAQAVALQTDGKIIVAGYAQNDFAVVRYNADGTLDSGFGNGGKVLTPVGMGVDEAYAVALQADGKIVVAGRAGADFAVVRYLSNGMLDTGFGTGGKVITNISGIDLAEAVAVQPDGKIVVAGWSGSSARFSLARYNADGSLDLTFGTGGTVIVPVGTSFVGDLAHAVALQADGKIIVAGEAAVDSGQTTFFRFALVRLNANGSLDAAFGEGGKVITAITNDGLSKIYDVAIQTDGKILAAGSSDVQSFGDTAVVRYNTNGTLDAGFGTGGIVTTRVGTIASAGEAVLLQANGKILVAGSSFSGAGAGSNDFSVLRLNANGSLDASFGVGGKVITPIGSRNDLVRDAALQPDGKIVVAGHSENATGGFNEDFAVVRYLGDTSIVQRPARFDFDGDGKTDYSVFRPANGVWYLRRSLSGFFAAQFGAATDRLTPADFDGDGKTDIAVFRDGTWYYLRSSDTGFRSVAFGAAGDTPVPNDYDGDGKADIAVFRQGFWYFLDSSNNQFRGLQFGVATDKAVPADFDGDGKTDVAVYRDGSWFYLRSSDGGFRAVQFGIVSDKAVPADFDGDGRADFAVYRDGVWYQLRSGGGFSSVWFGAATDKPAVGDYDGDGKADVAVWRPNNGTFYVLRSGDNGFTAFQWGASSDLPIAAAFVP